MSPLARSKTTSSCSPTLVASMVKRPCAPAGLRTWVARLLAGFSTSAWATPSGEIAMSSASCIIATTRFLRPASLPLIDQVLKLKPMAMRISKAEAESNATGTKRGMVRVRTGRVGSVAMMMRMGSRRFCASSFRRRLSSGAMMPSGAVMRDPLGQRYLAPLS